MRCIVTAGPTFEPLDAVRRLTNFSTGTLGCELANFLADARFDPELWLGAAAAPAVFRRPPCMNSFTTTSDLLSKFERLSQEGPFDGAIFHAAAVSDFMFGRLWDRDERGQQREVRSGKASTRSGTLLAELIPTPKIILQLRRLFPLAWLVGWKYEVDGGRDSVVERGLAQLREAGTNQCVLNGPAYGEGFGLLSSGGGLMELKTKDDLFAALLAALEQIPDVRGV